MYYKILLKDGRQFLAYRGFWERFWSGWMWTMYKLADTTFGPECKGKDFTIRSSEILGAITIGKSLSV
jgi:hypothetical protein